MNCRSIVLNQAEFPGRVQAVHEKSLSFKASLRDAMILVLMTGRITRLAALGMSLERERISPLNWPVIVRAQGS